MEQPLNLQLHPLQLGMNALADLSHEEYKQKYGLGFKRFNRKPSNKLQTFRYGALDADALPTAVDWRQQKAVAEVKNQAQVGTSVAAGTCLYCHIRQQPMRGLRGASH